MTLESFSNVFEVIQPWWFWESCFIGEKKTQINGKKPKVFLALWRHSADKHLSSWELHHHGKLQQSQMVAPGHFKARTTVLMCRYSGHVVNPLNIPPFQCCQLCSGMTEVLLLAKAKTKHAPSHKAESPFPRVKSTSPGIQGLRTRELAAMTQAKIFFKRPKT